MTKIKQDKSAEESNCSRDSSGKLSCFVKNLQNFSLA